MRNPRRVPKSVGFGIHGINYVIIWNRVKFDHEKHRCTLFYLEKNNSWLPDEETKGFAAREGRRPVPLSVGSTR